MPTKKADTTWMKNHPLEGDDVVTGLYGFLTKKNPKTMKPCRDICVPDTVVFERNFPRGWYTTDTKAREVTRKLGKELDASTIEKGFTANVSDSCPIVATYLCTQEVDLGGGETETKTVVEVLNKASISQFLARKTKHEGILQRFILPKGYHNSVIKVVWSPRVCLVQRRTNKYNIFDKKRAENDPFSTAVTYEGPTYLSEEGTVSGNIAEEVKRLCGNIVQHFYYTEHKFITRMVLYFKTDKQDRLWLLWCGSLRVTDRNTRSERPVNLVTTFTEPDTSAGFDEEKLLQCADEAYLRVTNDEMFFEVYMKHSQRSFTADNRSSKPHSAASPRPGGNTTADAQQRAGATAAAAEGPSLDWSTAPSLVQETRERLLSEKEVMLSLFDDLFYECRSYFVVSKGEPYVLTIPSDAVERLTESGVADMMLKLHLPFKEKGPARESKYVVDLANAGPITQLTDAAQDWITDFFDRKLQRLTEATLKLGDDDSALRETIAGL